MPNLGDGMKVLESLREQNALRLTDGKELVLTVVTFETVDGKLKAAGSTPYFMDEFVGITDSQVKRMSERLDPKTEARKAVERAAEIAKKSGMTVDELRALLGIMEEKKDAPEAPKDEAPKDEAPKK